MSTFTTPLDIRIVGKWRFELLAPFEYHLGNYPTKYNSDIITVPEGFITDLASIPRVFWSILSPIDEYVKAAVLHDWLYHTGLYSKTRTELIFKEAMQVLNTPKWKINSVYSAVYLFGHYRWYKVKRERNRIIDSMDMYSKS